MKRTFTVAVAAAVLGFGLACTGADTGIVGPEPVPEPAEATMEQKVGEIARAIDADPGARDQILQDHGMTAEAYEAELYGIAENPARTKAFIEARQGS
ncbi:MAG: hypothetical protein H6736_03050 [Alphaproteobacteria bacterium]|nr:hypothetical protein [Alphaproteobacteria bacterium]MCB9690772.1 hypothetical protein [Alphaproteobacteria bacterium]